MIRIHSSMAVETGDGASENWASWMTGLEKMGEASENGAFHGIGLHDEGLS